MNSESKNYRYILEKEDVQEKLLQNTIKLLTQKKSIELTGSEVRSIFQCFSSLNYFKRLPNALHIDDFNFFVRKFKIKKYSQGDEIYSVGEKSKFFYLILKGKVSISITKGNKNYDLVQLSDGESFGEYSIFLKLNREGTATCKEDTVIMMLNQEDYMSTFYEHENQYINFKSNLLKKNKFFDDFSNQDLEKLIFFFNTKIHFSDQQIYVMDQEIDGMNYIISGIFSISKFQSDPMNEYSDEKVKIDITQLKENDIFGEIEIFANSNRRMYNIDCVESGEVLYCSKNAIMFFLHQSLIKRKSESASKMIDIYDTNFKTKGLNLKTNKKSSNNNTIRNKNKKLTSVRFDEETFKSINNEGREKKKNVFTARNSIKFKTSMVNPHDIKFVVEESGDISERQIKKTNSLSFPKKFRFSSVSSKLINEFKGLSNEAKKSKSTAVSKDYEYDDDSFN